MAKKMTNVGKDVGKLEALCFADGTAKWFSHLWNHHMIQGFPFRVYSQRIQSKVLKRYLYTHVYNSVIHYIQKMKATVSVDRGMDKEMWSVRSVEY